jgi:hypothetical protein
LVFDFGIGLDGAGQAMPGFLVLLQQLIHLHQLFGILEFLFTKGDVHDLVVVMVGLFAGFLSSVGVKDGHEMAP